MPHDFFTALNWIFLHGSNHLNHYHPYLYISEKSAMYGFQEQLSPFIKGEQSHQRFSLRVSVGTLK